jgi:hypothetical protein
MDAGDEGAAEIDWHAVGLLVVDGGADTLAGGHGLHGISEVVAGRDEIGMVREGLRADPKEIWIYKRSRNRLWLRFRDQSSISLENEIARCHRRSP